MLMRTKHFKAVLFGALIITASSLPFAYAAPDIAEIDRSATATEPDDVILRTGITYEHAQSLLYSRSDRLKASNMSVQSAELRREGMNRLGGPSVAVSAMAYAYSIAVDVNLDPARNALSSAVSQLPPQIGGAVSQLPNLPNNYDFKRSNQNANLGVSAIWPIYTGGIPNAVRGELDAMTDETRAIATGDTNALNTVLIDRYFNAQLAQRAAELYAQALATIRQHDEAAQKMLENGIISQVERLEAKAALANAQDLSKQANDNASLASTALTRTIQSEHIVTPSTPLFLNTLALPPLQEFIDLAYLNHPLLKQIDAKKRQAGYMYDVNDALRKPQVLAFANHGVDTVSSGDSNWVAGMAVRWSLWSDINRKALMNASLKQKDQAEYTHAQAMNDIALLVEQNWLSVAHARERYHAQQADEDLAYELLKLRKVGLREGTSTPLELIDAELNLTRIKTERAATANTYIQSLAALLESAGSTERFIDYLNQANTHIQQEPL